MKKAIVIVIAVLIVVIIVFAGALQSGLLQGKSSGSVQNKYAPNVVVASDLNSSLGGSWNHESSGYGTSGNISSLLGLVSTQNVTIAASGGVEYSPALTVPTPSQSVYGNISSFEFSIFAPNHAGFAGVAIANYRNQADVNATFSYIDAKVTPVSNSTMLIARGNASGHQYIYVWTAVDSKNITPNNQNASLLLGLYKSHLIAIFYLTPSNLSQQNFSALYIDQINKLSSMTSTPVQNVLVSNTVLGGNIGGTWKTNFGINVQVNNASAIIHEFSGALATATGAQRQLINQTLGNLSEFALQTYSSGSGNQTILGFAKFLNNNVPYALYLDVLSLLANQKSNTGTGNVSGALYVFYHLYLGKSFFNPTPYALSLLVSDYNGYAIVGLYSGDHNVTQTQFANLLKAEVGLL